VVSIIIPSRSSQWLRQTVSDLLAKAKGEIEVIVVYDGRWPEPDELPVDDPRVVQIHHGEVHNHYGMRASINLGISASKGEYIMKIDEQCGVSEGYDTRLASICEDTMVIVPRRYRLEPETWTLVEDGRPPIDYMFVAYPYERPYDKTCGLHGDIWKRPERADIEVDDLMTMQGSCYFTKRSYWDSILPKGLRTDLYGTFTMEAQEISMTTWLSGGRLVVDKGCWYSHWHKGKNGKGYGFSTEQYRKHCEGMEKGRLYAIDYWLHQTDYERDMDWLIRKFAPVPTWPDNWHEQIWEDQKKDYSTLKYANDEWLKGLR
jgi:hypothetical protein